ncbi:hypothetical protein EXW39_28980 (plasmid) [Bacillus mycoides]|uniref:Uncharacterized protein n=1 Tax=Bacillus cereus HuA2-1 TaxID=1053201 RepID=J9B561_BACCE|nr:MULTISPECIES: hypothetical protein [Bacillus]AZJ24568.1 hypothetical protein CT694_34580 [Bacillus wiedmannii bv. thuringiensis]EJV74096.1 hypothetical protein IG3_05918 [Bacillus cereus HuA2-1]MBE7127641.1 hypothetical protein [Bacillus mycoides]MCR6850407.1 hypothetical protein [Bacillus sp. IBL03825]MED1406721.1 hypothetical protein [Bacillus mycoides]
MKRNREYIALRNSILVGWLLTIIVMGLSIYFSSIVYLLIGCFILSLKYGLVGTVKNVEKRLPTWANFGVIEKPVNRRVTRPFQFRGGLLVSLALGFVEMVIKGLCISYFILGLETYVYRLIRKNARV